MKNKKQESQTIKILRVFVPQNKRGWSDFPDPTIKGYREITITGVTIGGKGFIQYEFIPKNINLCNGGNAKRIRGNKIQLL